MNNAFMKFERRAEGADVRKLVETFVDVGPLFTQLGNTDHQIVHGRRGTGKTHALVFLAETRASAGDLAISCDLRTLGSNQSIYAKPDLPVSERGTRLLIDVLTELYNGLFRFAVDQTDRVNLKIVGPLLDQLADAIGQVRVEGTVQVETKATDKKVEAKEAGAGVTAGAASTANLNAKASLGQETAREARVSRTGSEHYYVHFGQVMSPLRDIMASMPSVRVWLLLDEWSTLPLDLQPYLADLIRRCICPIKGVTVKIAAIEQRSSFKIPLAQGSYIGLELGTDIPGDVNLDDFMVFDNQPERARDFFKRLFFNHINALEIDDAEMPKSADQLISAGFTQVNVFDELVQAAEGVPRDAMIILSTAAARALDQRISMKEIRDAARDWYQRGKERDLSTSERCVRLLNYIVDDVIGSKSARAFLLRSNTRDSLIEQLFDARVLHIVKRNVAGKDQPGVRFDVYKLDYGCYVELVNTAKAPKTLLALGEGDDLDEKKRQVPQDDYRSIRRAILDLPEFYKQAEAALVGIPA